MQLVVDDTVLNRSKEEELILEYKYYLEEVE